MLDFLCLPSSVSGLSLLVQGPISIPVQSFKYYHLTVSQTWLTMHHSHLGNLKNVFWDLTLYPLNQNLWNLGICISKKVPLVILLKQFTDLSSRTSNITDSSSVTLFWIHMVENLIDSACCMSILAHF